MVGFYTTSLRRHIASFHPELTGVKSPRKRTKRKQRKVPDVEKIIRQHLVELVTTCGRPLAILNDPPMRKILRLATNLENNHFTIENLKKDIAAAEQDLKQTIIAETRGKLVSLALDIVTKYGRSFLGVNVQYVLDEELTLRTLGVIAMNKSHTGVYICEMVLDILKDYQIDIRQLYSITTDNGKNVVKSIKDLQKLIDQLFGLPSVVNSDSDTDSDTEGQDIDIIMDDDEYSNVAQLLENVRQPRAEEPTQQSISGMLSVIGNTSDAMQTLLRTIGEEIEKSSEDIERMSALFCSAHTLQLAIVDGIKKWDDEYGLLAKSRRSIKKLRTPNIITIIRQKKLSLPVLNNNTRWNTIYLMVS